METVDITPTWKSLVPAMILVLQNPKASADAHNQCRIELMRLAEFADEQNLFNRTKEGVRA